MAPRPDEAFDLGVVVLRSDQQVEVDPVLHRLGLGHRLEEDAPAGARPPLVDGIVGMAQRSHRPPASLPVDLDREVGRHVAGLEEAIDELADLLVFVVEGLGPEGGHRVGLGGVEDDLGTQGGHPTMVARPS